MNDSAISTGESGCSADGSPATNTSPAASPPAAAGSAPPVGAAGATAPVLSVKVKQVKTKVTERIRKNPDGTKSKIWDVQVGSALVRVYFTPSGDREFYTVSYWVDSKRKREVFRTYDKAIDKAKEAGGQLAKGDLGSADLSAAQRVACVRAMQLLAPTGVPIEVAAGEYAEAFGKLKGRASLAAVVEFYLKRHPKELEFKPVKVVVAELIAAKRADGGSERYLESLGYNLRKFEKRFQGDITAVAGADIDSWLRESGLSPRTRNNIRGSVNTLFGFARSKWYLAKDHDEIDSVQTVKDREGAIEVFTPAELVEILNHAGEGLIPFITLGAFAGIRHAEIQRLDWRDVRFDDGIVEIHAAKAKTASRRTVPILDNLREWLLQCRQPSGLVCPCKNVAFEMHLIAKRANEARRSAWARANGVKEEELKRTAKRVRKAAKKANVKGRQRGEVPPGAEMAKAEGWEPFAWKHNALRHSFISYRVAQIQNVAQVALEAGNSPQMIFRNYRELVRPSDAKTWFSLVPGTDGKVIYLQPKNAEAALSGLAVPR